MTMPIRGTPSLQAVTDVSSSTNNFITMMGDELQGVTNVNTTPFLVSITDYPFIIVDTSALNIEVRLPGALAVRRRKFAILDGTGQAPTHNITIRSMDGALIFPNGGTTLTINGAFNSYTIFGDGSNFHVF